MRDLYRSDNSFNIAILRYFNGSPESGPSGRPSRDSQQLVPYITQVASGRLKELQVFGNDYPTPDGTGVRDYIHVVDLVIGHLKALDKLKENPGVVTYNLGTGKGYSVLEMVDAFEKVTGKPIPYKIVGRRPGDIAVCYADPTKAAKELNWRATRGLEEMARDSWRWQYNNPDGYGDEH